MKKIFLLACLISLAGMATAAEPFTIKLYPNGPAESNEIKEAERVVERIGFIYNVTDARLDVYLPEERKSDMMILVCPGGGYSLLAEGGEGKATAEFLNRQGVAAAVLKYRMPNRHNMIPLTDALTAMELIRSHAEEWKINAGNVGVIGFSAGGHLASTVITKYTSKANRPDFGMLIYPVITMDERYTHSGTRENLIGLNYNAELVNAWSSELNVTADTPPTFIAVSSDDKLVPVKNSLLFFQALLDKGVKNCELHIFPTGDHGWGFSRKFDGRDEMETSLMNWLNERKNK